MEMSPERKYIESVMHPQIQVLQDEIAELRKRIKFLEGTHEDLNPGDAEEIKLYEKKLSDITSQNIFTEYYSHENGECYKILNEYTKYRQDKKVLCQKGHGYLKALKLAVEAISKEKEIFENEV